MYEKFVISDKDLEQFNVCYNDEIICDRDLVAVPGELAILYYELSKDYGIYEGIDAEGYHVMRYLNGRATRVNPREGWTCIARVIAVFRKRLGRYEDVKGDIIVSARFRKVSTTLMPNSIPVSVSRLGVFASGEKIWVSSRDVAEKFGKPHNDVLKNIRRLDCSAEFTAGNFSLSEYKDPTGRTLPQYLMTRDGFTFLAMGFTGAKAARFKEAYIAEFNRMEEELYKRRYCALPANTGFSPLTQREATALATAAAASKREQATRRRLYKALDTIERLQRRIEAEKG